VRHRGASDPRAWLAGKRVRNRIEHRAGRPRIALRASEAVAAHYKGRLLGEYVIDVVVEDLVVVEVKAVERIAPVFQAQILHYMRVSHKRLGLLMNFNSRLMKDGIDRFAL
jgi:GxxExxY protein